jgi:hypothetical protein
MLEKESAKNEQRHKELKYIGRVRHDKLPCFILSVILALEGFKMITVNGST